MSGILQEVAYVLSLKLNFSGSYLLCLESKSLPDPKLHFLDKLLSQQLLKRIRIRMKNDDEGQFWENIA